jgi:hypothetical protein
MFSGLTALGASGPPSRLPRFTTFRLPRWSSCVGADEDANLARGRVVSLIVVVCDLGYLADVEEQLRFLFESGGGRFARAVCG